MTRRSGWQQPRALARGIRMGTWLTVSEVGLVTMLCHFREVPAGNPAMTASEVRLVALEYHCDEVSTDNLTMATDIRIGGSTQPSGVCGLPKAHLCWSKDRRSLEMVWSDRATGHLGHQ